MKRIPKTENSLVLRTNFSDQAAWQSLCAAIEEPVGDFKAHVDFVSDPDFDKLDAAALVERMPDDSQTFAFIVDTVALTDPAHPILVVDLLSDPGRTFRVIPSEMWAVENNLAIANMGFEEFAAAVDSNGIFRGFPKS